MCSKFAFVMAKEFFWNIDWKFCYFFETFSFKQHSVHCSCTVCLKLLQDNLSVLFKMADASQMTENSLEGFFLGTAVWNEMINFEWWLATSRERRKNKI